MVSTELQYSQEDGKPLVNQKPMQASMYKKAAKKNRREAKPPTQKNGLYLENLIRCPDPSCERYGRRKAETTEGSKPATNGTGRKSAVPTIKPREPTPEDESPT